MPRPPRWPRSSGAQADLVPQPQGCLSPPGAKALLLLEHPAAVTDAVPISLKKSALDAELDFGDSIRGKA